ncbi:MAG: hypothetical protein MJA31_11950 [Clostridia bacterium]|nr:hypothetical protein [Clostridia bacterium]
MIDENKTVRQIVSEIPEAKRVFDVYGITCRPNIEGGDLDRTVVEAARRYNIDKSVLINNLSNMELIHSRLKS